MWYSGVRQFQRADAERTSIGAGKRICPGQFQLDVPDDGDREGVDVRQVQGCEEGFGLTQYWGPLVNSRRDFRVRGNVVVGCGPGQLREKGEPGAVVDWEVMKGVQARKEV